MNKEKLIYWANKYDQEEDLYNKGDEKELHVRFRQNGYVVKSDLIKLTNWKFQGRLEGRRRRITKLFDKMDDQAIEGITRLVFKIRNSDELKIKLLRCIDGVGVSLASVILSFYDPTNYGILDIHAWRGLFGEEPKDIFTNNKHILKFFLRLREISVKTGLACREIEKAYFKKDLDEQ